MKIGEAMKEMEQRLAGFTSEFPQESRLFVSYLTGIPYAQLDLHLQEVFPADKKFLFLEMARRRLNGEPPQYIVGNQEFMSLDFQVNPSVLIPRFDTECVVEQALALLKGKGPCRVGDVGTGSGAIAVSIAYYSPAVEVWAVDISEAALNVAQVNATAHGVAERVFFQQGDLCNPLPKDLTLLVSNPPYVSEREMAELSREVKQEPIGALYGGPDGLNFYRRLAKESPAHLSANGMLLVEIGCTQRDAVCQLLQETGFSQVHCGKDYAGRDRWIAATYQK